MCVLKLVQKSVPIYSVDAEVKAQLELPWFFGTPVRRDLIRRAFIALYSSALQPQGRDPLAGKKVSVESFGTGRELARLPRHSSGRAGFAPMARGGYKPHPPRVDKNTREEINAKEKRLALVSALSASSDVELVKARGHVFDTEKIKVTPLVVEDQLEGIERTREAYLLLMRIGLLPDLVRVKASIKERAGKGKSRGRRYRMRKGPLVVVTSQSSSAAKAFRNIPGVDVQDARSLSILDLAPGGVPGRFVIFTQKALKELSTRIGENE